MEVRRGSYTGAAGGSGDSGAGWGLIMRSCDLWHLHRLEQCPHAAGRWVGKTDFGGMLRRGVWRFAEVATWVLTSVLGIAGLAGV